MGGRIALILAIAGCGFEAEPVVSDWTQVVGGDGHSCGIRGDTSLWCWGDNASGQAGTGPASNELLEPTLVDDQPWTQVSAGASHTCGVKLDGTLWCWGRNAEHQLGVATPMDGDALVPTQVIGSWTQVAAGAVHTCALDEMQRLKCWGDNARGQLGDNSLAASPTPKPIGSDRWLQIQTGNQTTCGIRIDQTLWCWGANTNGTVGDATNADRDGPVQVPGAWREVALAYLHACAIRMDGRLRCWGHNTSGQIGDGTTTERNSPRAVGTDHDDWTDVAVGRFQTCGVRGDPATLSCWGGDAAGQIGVSENRALVNASPVEIEHELVAGLGLGYGHSCAIVGEYGDLSCTGRNGYGQLGTTDGGSRRTPVQIDGMWDRIVAAGSSSTCGRREDGSLWCWGDNSVGQLGDDIAGPRQVPAMIAGGVRAAIAVGGEHACELRGTQVWCWGNNPEGQLGDSVTGTRAPSLVGGVTATSLSARAHTCAVPASGSGVVCWGRNSSGQLGRGHQSPDPSIALSFNGVAFSQVIVGGAHTCGVIAGTNRLSCWGANADGQLGDGTTNLSLAQRDQPTTGWSGVGTGAAHTCGIRGGEMFCWGRNRSGQLGDDSMLTSPTPVQAGNDQTWQQVVAGIAHTCGLQGDGAGGLTLWCWGSNRRGQLGQGSFVQSNVPVQIGDDRDWEFLGTGDEHTCATKTDGSLWCWGADEAGQIGDDTAWRVVWTPR